MNCFVRSDDLLVRLVGKEAVINTVEKPVIWPWNNIRSIRLTFRSNCASRTVLLHEDYTTEKEENDKEEVKEEAGVEVFRLQDSPKN